MVICVATTAKRLIAAGGLAFSLIGFGAFAGTAAADPEACQGEIGPGSDHQPFAVGPAADAACEFSHDTSDTSMTDIGAAGSWPGHVVAFTAKPQS
jgi:hypothetical protein